MPQTNVGSIVNLVNASLPAVFAIVQALHKERNPDAPPLTDAQVFAALHDWAIETVAKDDALAADIRARNG